MRFQRFKEIMKYYDAPPTEQWNGMANSATYSVPNVWRSRTPKPMNLAYYGSEDIGYANDSWREHETDAVIGGAIATPYGTISLRLHNRIRIDMTVDKAVRVINFKVRFLAFCFSQGTICSIFIFF